MGCANFGHIGIISNFTAIQALNSSLRRNRSGTLTLGGAVEKVSPEMVDGGSAGADPQIEAQVLMHADEGQEIPKTLTSLIAGITKQMPAPERWNITKHSCALSISTMIMGKGEVEIGLSLHGDLVFLKLFGDRVEDGFTFEELVEFQGWIHEHFAGVLRDYSTEVRKKLTDFANPPQSRRNFW